MSVFSLWPGFGVYVVDRVACAIAYNAVPLLYRTVYGRTMPTRMRMRLQLVSGAISVIPHILLRTAYVRMLACSGDGYSSSIEALRTVLRTKPLLSTAGVAGVPWWVVGLRLFAGFHKMRPDALLEWRYLLPPSHALADRRTVVAAVVGAVGVAGWAGRTRRVGFPMLPVASVCGLFPLAECAFSTAVTSVSLWYFGHLMWVQPFGTLLGVAVSIPLHVAVGRARKAVARLCGFEVCVVHLTRSTRQLHGCTHLTYTCVGTCSRIIHVA